MKIIFKISVISAWLLVIATLFALFSGFSVSKNYLFSWININTAYFLHNNLAQLIFIPLFYIHSLMGLLLLFSRHKLFAKIFAKILVAVSWTLIFGSLIFVYVSVPPVQNVANNSQQVDQINSSGNISLSLQEIAKHNLPQDCWMIINNKVYDFTNYLTAHPGGARTITPYCGKDGTNAFATKNRNIPHSSYADTLLSSFYLGDLNQIIGSQKIQNINFQTQNIPQQEDEFEDD